VRRESSQKTRLRSPVVQRDIVENFLVLRGENHLVLQSTSNDLPGNDLIRVRKIADIPSSTKTRWLQLPFCALCDLLCKFSSRSSVEVARQVTPRFLLGRQFWLPNCCQTGFKNREFSESPERRAGERKRCDFCVCRPTTSWFNAWQHERGTGR
jgi:hypothetical protein